MNNVKVVSRQSIPVDKAGTFWDIDGEVYILTNLGFFICLKDGKRWTNRQLTDSDISILGVQTFISGDDPVPAKYLGYCNVTLRMGT